VLTLANPLDGDQVRLFVAEVGHLSHGSLRIVVRNGWRARQATAESETIRDVETGKADLGVAGTSAWDSLGVASLRGLDAPLLIDSYALQDKVLRSRRIGKILRGLHRFGLVGLGVLPGPLERPFGMARPLLRPSDYRGARVGVRQSRVAGVALRALGAKPVWIASRGPLPRLGAAEWDLTTDPSRFHRGGSLTRNVVLWPRPAVVFASRRAFARLAPAQQRVLEEALAASIGPETRYRVSYDAIDAALTCGRPGFRLVTATAEGRSALRRAVRPVYAQLERDRQVRRLISQIEAVRARLAEPPDSMPRCRTASSLAAAATGPSPVDGEYEVTVRPTDLPAGKRLPEQYGTWRLVLDRGRFRLSEGSDGADWNADGSVRLAGARMTWTVVDALDWAPHGAPDGVPLARGDTVVFRWRRSGTAIVLAAKGPLAGLAARPLARVGDAPGQQRLQNPAGLDGVWSYTVTASDYKARRHGDAGGIEDNIGPLRLAIHGERCRWTQRAPDGFHWGNGTCRFAGDTLEFDQAMTDGGEGFPFFMHWSLFHERLTFRPAPGVSMIDWTGPWRKLG
jgi:TRAP-type C4-dicarboxylate transport system substrate-binding protein